MINVSEELVFELESIPEEGRATGKVDNLDKLHPCIIDCESQTTPVEELH